MRNRYARYSLSPRVFAIGQKMRAEYARKVRDMNAPKVADEAPEASPYVPSPAFRRAVEQHRAGRSSKRRIYL